MQKQRLRRIEAHVDALCLAEAMRRADPEHALTPDAERAALADLTRLLRLQALIQREGIQSSLTQLVAQAYGVADVAAWAAWLERLWLTSGADQQAVWWDEPRVRPRS
jgi:hypothetical protein